MNTLMKRVISLILCFVLMTSCLPVGAIAQEIGEQPSEGLVQTTDPSEEPSDPSEESSEPSEEPSDPSEESSEPSEETSEPVVDAAPGITLDVTSLKVRVGDEPVTLTATVTPEGAADVAVIWTSSNPEVASVDENGVVTFGAIGEAVITAAVGELIAECAVTVRPEKWIAYSNKDVIDAAIFFSDLHVHKEDQEGKSTDKTDVVADVFDSLKLTGNPYTTVNSCGDTFSVNNDSDSGSFAPFTGYTSVISGWIRNALGDSSVQINYVYSDHDRYAVEADGTTTLSNESRFVYGAGRDGIYGTDDDGNYYVYLLSMADLGTNNRYNADFHTAAEVEAAIADFLADAKGLKQDRPLFIASHMPLYDNRNDNGYAYDWCVAINEIAENMDVAYFHGHNHKYDAADGSEYYFAKGSTMSVCKDSYGNATNVELKFTHINAGYLEPVSTTSYKASTTRMNVAISAVIYADRIEYVTYDGENGVYADKFALMESVTRDHAVIDEGDSDDTPTEDPIPDESKPEDTVTEAEDKTTGIIIAAPGVTSVTVTPAEQEVPEEYDVSVSYDITPVGYNQGDEATVTIPVDTTVFNPALPVVVLYNGEVIATSYIVGGKVTFTTNHFTIYTIAQTNETVDLTGTWVTITAPTGGTTTYTYTQATSITAGSKYVIVGNKNDVALMNSNNAIGKQDVTISGTTTMTSTTKLTEWTFSANSNGTEAVSMSIYDESRYLGYSNSRFNLNATPATLSVSDSGDNFRISSGSRYFYYNGSNWATSSRNSAQSVRLYTYTSESTTGGTAGFYAQASGRTSLTVPYGSDQDEILAAVKDAITVYTTNNTTANSAVTVIDDANVTWTPTMVDDNSWTVAVKYQNKTLQTVDVRVSAREVESVNLSSYNGSVVHGYTDTNTKIIITYVGGETEEINVTTDMLTGSFDISKNGKYPNLTVSYEGYTFPGYTLNVTNIPGIDDYPAYPKPGSVDLKKSATGLDFQNTGMARVELSTSGLPCGIDVVVIMDTGSSMSGARITAAKNALKAMLTKFMQTNQATGADIDVSVVGFNGFNGTDFQYISGASLTNSGRTTADSALCYTSTNGPANKDVYNASSQFQLDATNFMNASKLTDTNINTLVNSISAGSGTNYDGGLASGYRLLAAKKAASETPRHQFVVFMSDGAGFLYNGFMAPNSSSNGGRTQFNRWLTGEWESVEALKEAINNDAFPNGNKESLLKFAEFYNGNGENHPNRIAEAIKGSPAHTYTVVRSGAGATNNYQEQWQGLGAKIYSIGLEMADDTYSTADGVVTMETLYEVINVIGSGTGYGYPDATEVQLTSVFEKVAEDISFAATNARFIDQMGSAFELQMNPYVNTNATGSGGQTQVNTNITISTRPVYTQLDFKNGNCAQDDIGKPYGNGTPVETVTFNFSAQNKNATLVSVTSSVKDGNILGEDGVIYGQYFFYNTTSSIKTITLADGSTYDLPGETFYWNIGTINEKQFTLSYTVYLSGSCDDRATPVADTYPTNNFAILYYDNHVGNSVYQSVPSPVLAWSGAQVNYAFYLVDAAGNPVYKDGSIAPNFYTAYRVTTPVLYNSIELNTGVELVGAFLADDVLPEGYVLYAPDVHYTVSVASGNADGHYSSWQITNGKNATYVTGYGSATDYTNLDYATTDTSKSDTVNYQPSFDYANTTVWFPVVWIPSTIPDVVVIDYGLSVDINALDNDQFGSYGTLNGICSVDAALNSLKTTSGANVTLDTLNTIHVDPDNKLTTGNPYTSTYGKAEILNGKIRYTPADMTMESYDRFVYEVKYEIGKELGYLYGTVTVIPATTIYYEESFITFSGSNGSTGLAAKPTTGSLTSGQWYLEGATSNDTQGEDRPGSFSLPSVDANNLYGYDGAYTEFATYSLGSAAMIHVDSSSYGKANFTFAGTGFDVVSLTSNTTGTIIVQVRRNGAMVKSAIIDTYYGMNQDGTTTGATNTPDTIYQVPVIKFFGLEYGTYDVTITATYNSSMDHTADAGYDLYLDSIRIYDPAGTTYGDDGEDGATGSEIDDVVEGAYKADGEAYPQYMELRNKIIGANSFNVTANTDGTVTVAGDPVVGIVFIDCNDGTSSIADYKSYGPNNEVYLANGQAIAFNMNLTNSVSDIQLGIKMANGTPVTYAINGTAYTVSTATDMYYSIKNHVMAGVIVIENISGGILSLTNIKTTYTSAPGTNRINLQNMDAKTVEFALMSLNSTEEEEEIPETTAPETIESTEATTETTAPQETETEDKAPDTAVTEETEPEETVPETTETDDVTSEEDTSEEEQAEGFGASIIKFFKKLFNWLFGWLFN